MSELEKLKDELEALNFKASGGLSFAEAMQVAAEITTIEQKLLIAQAGMPRAEPPPYTPGGRATEMRSPTGDLSSPFGGHDSLKVVEKLWTR